jgi:hypothetical protein
MVIKTPYDDKNNSQSNETAEIDQRVIIIVAIF